MASDENLSTDPVNFNHQKEGALQPHCAFCSRSLAEVAFLFASSIGGNPPCICDACIDERASHLEMERKSPGFLAEVIAIQRRKIDEVWAQSHPGERRMPL